MNKPGIILIGAGGHAHACIDVIEQQGQFIIAGLVGRQDEVGLQHLGYSVIAADDDLERLAKSYQYAFITVGQIESPGNRIRLYQQAVKQGFQFPAIIAPSAYASCTAVIGAGTIVMHGAIINAGARVGNNCIINTRALIEHDVTIDDHCHISTGAILNGGANAGTGCFVGSGSIIKEGVSLESNCVVGMGLSVRHHLVENTKFVGDHKV